MVSIGDMHGDHQHAPMVFRVAIITAVIIMIKSAIGQVEHDRTASVTCADGGGSAWSG